MMGKAKGQRHLKLLQRSKMYIMTRNALHFGLRVAVVNILKRVDD